MQLVILRSTVREMVHYPVLLRVTLRGRAAMHAEMLLAIFLLLLRKPEYADRSMESPFATRPIRRRRTNCAVTRQCTTMT